MIQLKVTQSQLDDVQYITEQLNIPFYGDIHNYQEVQDFIEKYIDEANNVEKQIEHAYFAFSNRLKGF